MLQDIDAASTTPNTPFRGTVTQDILRNGKVVVPVGSELHGRVVYATAGRRLNGGSVIHLRPDEFVLPDGTRYHLHAQVIDTKAPTPSQGRRRHCRQRARQAQPG
jgi:hypothetical protein